MSRDDAPNYGLGRCCATCNRVDGYQQDKMHCEPYDFWSYQEYYCNAYVEYVGQIRSQPKTIFKTTEVDQSRNWIELHKYKGPKVTVDAAHISSMSYNPNYDYTQVHLVGGQMLEIRESVDEIMSLISDVYTGVKR